jgi:hypothetical protein
MNIKINIIKPILIKLIMKRSNIRILIMTTTIKGKLITMMKTIIRPKIIIMKL